MSKIIKFLLFGLVGITISAYAMRDPTEPAGDNTKTTINGNGNIQVDSILSSKDRNLALIAGRYYKVGDNIMGAKVTEIHPTFVRFQDSSGEFFSIDVSHLNIKSRSSTNKGNNS